MKNNKVIKNEFDYSYDSILNVFFEINQFATNTITKWRKGKQLVFNKVDNKGIHTIVTEADRKIEAFAIAIFKKIAPEVGIFSEENFKDDFSTTYQQRYFVIDPIDGTAEFARGGKDWSVSLCLVDNGKPVVASIYMPDKNFCAYAIKGNGVYINGKEMKTRIKFSQKIGVSPRQINKPSFRVAIKNTGFKPVGISSLTSKICSILKEEIDAAVYFPQEGRSAILWDYAATVLLIHETGGRITSLDGKELPFIGKEVIHKGGWLAASSPKIYNHIQPLLEFN